MEEFWVWLRTLDPEFAFLLALPFIVAAAGLLVECIRDWRKAGSKE